MPYSHGILGWYLPKTRIYLKKALINIRHLHFEKLQGLVFLYAVKEVEYEALAFLMEKKISFNEYELLEMPKK